MDSFKNLIEKVCEIRERINSIESAESEVSDREREESKRIKRIRSRISQLVSEDSGNYKVEAPRKTEDIIEVVSEFNDLVDEISKKGPNFIKQA